ncbi:LIC_10190 family membrane protein [Butyrivibrio sp. AE2032]|uniref:LIC_10190 family membrane protein n=1 Tax=Butyrivibrio sp. AE2032 TaxID=1458463 RepID=UPI000552086D|nr:hypothetical protein [Butyrivibrio sp. AE2032]
MLAVTLIWLYVIITTYLVGYGFLMSLVNWPGMHRKKSSKGIKRYDFRFKESYIITGIVLVTVYAQIVSLFSKVALGANIVLISVCLLIAVYYRYELMDDLMEMTQMITAKGNIYIYLAVFLLMAYGTSHGLMHYDSDLYHAQAIHWIEEYGIVKGLGNLHVRLAYNSSAFALSALYSMSFLGGQSFHVMSGFFSLLLAWQCVDIRNVFRRGHFVISDFARLAAIYYLFTVFDEMVAPASDYFLSAIVFYVIIHWLDMYVKHERSYVPYILLALLGVFAITIKLSAAPMVLLSIIPIYKLFHERTPEKVKALLISIVLALVIVLPFLIRNVVISGWILYPVTLLDFFGFKWEIPKGVAAFDAIQIKTFGRGYNDVAVYMDVSMGEWVPHWFESITGISKIMVILDMVSIVVFLVYLIYFLVAVAGQKSSKIKLGNSKVFELSHRSMLNTADFITISATLVGCLGFWFFSAPLIRYGVVYVWLVPAVILGRLVILGFNKLEEAPKSIIMKAVTAILLLWLAYKAIFLVVDDSGRYNPVYLVKQQDYGEYETKEFELNGVKIYYPATGDQVGYYPFPAATHDLTGEVELMGNDVKDGFKSVQ